MMRIITAKTALIKAKATFSPTTIAAASVVVLSPLLPKVKEASELHLEEFPLAEDRIPVLTSFKVSYAQTV